MIVIENLNSSLCGLNILTDTSKFGLFELYAFLVGLDLWTTSSLFRLVILTRTSSLILTQVVSS